MILQDARAAIRQTGNSFSVQILAANVIAASANSTYEDLLACLHIQGLPAETASLVLYRRTGRPKVDDSPLAFVVDYEDWRAYLQSIRAIGAAPATLNATQPSRDLLKAK